MAEAKLFSIGEVAKLFHVSVSSLRHYEAAGLLQPEYISPDSGYRHYSTRQFEVLNTLRYLRALGMPLHEIADFLQNRNLDSIEQKLCQQKAAVAEKRAGRLPRLPPGLGRGRTEHPRLSRHGSAHPPLRAGAAGGRCLSREGRARHFRGAPAPGPFYPV